MQRRSLRKQGTARLRLLMRYQVAGAATWLPAAAQMVWLHCKTGGQGRDRTAGLPLFRRIRSVAACRWTWP